MVNVQQVNQMGGQCISTDVLDSRVSQESCLNHQRLPWRSA